jgi:pyridoxal phosphate enzyme (YggS family)
VSDAEVAARLASLRERIEAAAARAGRRPDAVTLVGASKRQPPEKIAAAARAGLGHLGESYVQEAAAKLPRVRAALEPLPSKPLILHLIGRLQRNKAGAAVELFDVIETLDRPTLGDALERRAAAAGRRLDVLLQVDVSGEPQKGGVSPDALPALLACARRWPHLRVRGLMAIPAAQDAPERMRPAFARLRELRDGLRATPEGAGLEELSMGMSADFEVAIEEGATIVRVGTALFGPREA